MKPSSPTSEQTVLSPRASERRSFRWRIIPVVFHSLLAALGLLGCTVHIGAVAYYNGRYGWIKYDRQHRSLSELAITPLNVSVWQCQLWAFVISGFAAYYWLRGRWRLACLSSVVFLSLMFASKWLETWPQ